MRPLARFTPALIVAVVLVASLAQRAAFPEWVIADAGHDDQLFARSAASLRSGDWLGPYDNRTLLKGSGFPMWLAVTSSLPLPFLLTQHGLLLAAAGTFAVAMHRISGSRPLALVLFTVLALNPAFVGSGASRIHRDNWYAALCLLFFALVVLLLTRPINQAPGLASLGRYLFGALPVGLVAGLYWIGREERVWLLPSLLFFAGSVVLVALAGLAKDRSGLARLARAAPRVSACVVAVGVCSLVISAVQTKNGQRYGAAVVTDFADGEFVQAYGLWQSVHASPARPYVLVSAQQREKVYSVSPAAAELRVHLEGPLLKGNWIPPGCSALRVCDDYAAGWFPFALRDAVAAAGHYGSAAQAQAYFARLAQELKASCRTGTLPCSKAPVGLAPVAAQIRVEDVAASAVNGFSYLATFGVAEPSRPISNGQAPNYQLFESVVPGLEPSLSAQQRAERSAERRWFLPRAGRVLYGAATLLAGPAALLGFALALRRRLRGVSLPWLVGVACLSAVVTRTGLLALVDATAFPAARTSYVLPASPFLLAAIVIGCWLMLRCVRVANAVAPPTQLETSFAGAGAVAAPEGQGLLMRTQFATGLQSRELLVNLTMREVRGKYKRTALGQGWSLLNPVVTLAIYSLVFGLLLRANPPVGSPSGIDVFALWLAGGLLPWTFFSGAVQAGMQSLILNANLVKKVYFPREVLVSSAVLAFVVTFGVELVALTLLLLVAGASPLPWLPFVALAVALLTIFALGLGLLLAISNVYFRDTSYLMALAFQFWFYLTPVVYPTSLVEDVVRQRGGIELLGVEIPIVQLYNLNPMQRFSDVFRSLMYDNRMPDWQDWAGCMLSAAVALAVGVLVFRRFSARLVEEL